MCLRQILKVFITKMTTPSLENTKESKVKSKGKHASSTENRRMVWEKVVWPLILEVNRSYFNLKEYHTKRDEFCRLYNIQPSKVAGGFVSCAGAGASASLQERRAVFLGPSASGPGGNCGA